VGGFDSDFGSAGAALAAIRDGTISCRELVERVLARIDAQDPRLNLFITLDREGALAQAGAADDLPAPRRGPLHGLPVTV
jgi:Asp-tRNA(Asn)/Glu-tRNA(Gln) amidotransferase A subunit family amidase